MKNKIIEILNSEMYNVSLEEGGVVNVVEEDDFNDIAERIVKLFAIPDVSNSNFNFREKQDREDFGNYAGIGFDDD